MPKRSTNFNSRRRRITAAGLLGLMDALGISPEDQRQIVERAAAQAEAVRVKAAEDTSQRPDSSSSAPEA